MYKSNYFEYHTLILKKAEDFTITNALLAPSSSP